MMQVNGKVNRDFLKKIKWRWLIAFLLITACVDPINFKVPPPKFLLVVEGMISDRPGPYTIKVSRSLGLDAISLTRTPVINCSIQLYDDAGNVEDFYETTTLGTYATRGVMQGQVGRTYHIQLKTGDGKTFESTPEQIKPVGEVESIRQEFEGRTVATNYGEKAADVFKIFIDAKGVGSDENYVRWRFTGTHQVVTYPELHEIFLQVSAYKDPLPCSGYIITPALGGGKILKVDECTCCTCWVNQYESAPLLSDEQLVDNKEFRNIKVGEVPVNNITFAYQYMVLVEQMSLSRNTFDFFKLIRAQKEGASSLFQPPYGEIKGNIKAIDSQDPVVGLFWATSISSKAIFLTQNDVPYPVTPPDVIADDCSTFYENSSTTKPEFWQ